MMTAQQPNRLLTQTPTPLIPLPRRLPPSPTLQQTLRQTLQPTQTAQQPTAQQTTRPAVWQPPSIRIATIRCANGWRRRSTSRPPPTHTPLQRQRTRAAATTSSLGSAMLPVLFAYSGWFYINNIAGEIREPQRNIPRALVLGMLTCTACYLLANYAYLHVLGQAGLAASTAPAAELMQRAFGSTGSLLIGAGIAISTFGFCNIAILGGSRMFQVMGADGVFFRATAHLHPTYRSPDVALAVLALWSALLVLSGSYGQLLDYATIGDWIGSAMVAATLFYYRRRESAQTVFRAPLHPLLPLAFIAAVAFVVISSAIAQPRETLIGLGIIVLGVPAYYLWRFVYRPR